jgi:hypothetical protein
MIDVQRVHYDACPKNSSANIYVIYAYISTKKGEGLGEDAIVFWYPSLLLSATLSDVYATPFVCVRQTEAETKP